LNILYFLVPAALMLGLIFVVSFVWMVRSGQYEDLETPAIRILMDEEKIDLVLENKNNEIKNKGDKQV
jgi:cbb3-type cytochrome oxidase maturation protein